MSHSNPFQCRQAPFGDFCAEINPASARGHWAWRNYNPETSSPLPDRSTEPVPCQTLSETVSASYGPGDIVCNNDYVWRCRGSTSRNYCQRYGPESANGYLAWELLEGVPEPISAAAEVVQPEATPAETEAVVQPSAVVVPEVPEGSTEI